MSYVLVKKLHPPILPSLPLSLSLSASLLCVPLFFLLSWKRPPNVVMQIVLMIAAFVMSVLWLYLIANEVVSVLQALGLLTKISTGLGNTHFHNNCAYYMYTIAHTPVHISIVTLLLLLHNVILTLAQCSLHCMDSEYSLSNKKCK